MQRERNRPRTIIAAIVKRSVPAAPDIGLATQGIRRPDCVLHALRRVRGRISDSALQNSAASRHHRSFSAFLDAAALFLLLILILIILLRPWRRCLRPPGS